MQKNKEDNLINKGDSTCGSFWIYHVNLSCCGLEVVAAAGPRFDWERLGCKLVMDHKIAEVLLVSGPVNEKLGLELKKIHSEMVGRRLVISMGSCANSGGMFATGSIRQILPLENFLPVSAYVPGCPPRPESVLKSILFLRENYPSLDGN